MQGKTGGLDILKYQALLKIFQDNPCETTQLETEKVKSELEA